jgi:hypothetical protein
VTADDSDGEWVLAQRDTVVAYLAAEGVAHGQVGDWPAWHLSPYVAIWAIESLRTPGWVGWWVISGDLPTDYISSVDARDPRAAMRQFARNWADFAPHLLKGRQPPGTVIGSVADPEVGDLLQRRSAILQSWADDDEVWAS